MIALVTGASSGIGEALCRLLAKKGYSLVITGRNTERLEALERELSTPVETITADLTRYPDRYLVIQRIHNLTPDLVINNAGFGLYGFSEEIGVGPQLQMIDLNVTALAELTIESIRALQKANKKGTILNVSSMAAYHAFPLFAVYGASKSFVNSFSEALDEEQMQKGTGIRILASCPGQVATDFATRASQNQFKQNVNNSEVMTSEFAASEIWKQIEKGQRVRIFNFRYRFFAFIMRYLIPEKLIMSLLFKRMLNRVN